MSLSQISQFMSNLYNQVAMVADQFPDSPMANAFMDIIGTDDLLIDWQLFNEDSSHPFDYARVLRMLGLPNPFIVQTRRRGQGIFLSKPKDKNKPKPFEYTVPSDFPSIKDKLTSLYKFYKYDTELGAQKMADNFTSDDIKAIRKFVNNPTIDNLGTMPLSYRDYIVKYNTYVKKVNDLQEAKDLERWRRRYK